MSERISALAADPTADDALANKKAWKRAEQDLLLLLRKEPLDPEESYDNNMRIVLSTLRARLRERRTPDGLVGADMLPTWTKSAADRLRDTTVSLPVYIGPAEEPKP